MPKRKYRKSTLGTTGLGSIFNSYRRNKYKSRKYKKSTLTGTAMIGTPQFSAEKDRRIYNWEKKNGKKWSGESI